MLFYLCKSSHFTIHARKIDCHTTSRGYANKGVFAGTIRRREWWRERWRRLTNTRLTNEATSGNSARQLSSNASKSRGRFNPISRLLLSSSFAFYPQLLSLSPPPPRFRYTKISRTLIRTTSLPPLRIYPRGVVRFDLFDRAGKL